MNVQLFTNLLILTVINVKDILALQHVKKKTQIKHTKHIKIAALTKDTAPVRTYQSLEIKKTEGKRNNKNEEAHHSNDVIRELHYGKRKYVFR